VPGDTPQGPPIGPLLDRLRVRRNVAVGVAVGCAIAATLYAVRVFGLLGPPPDRGSPMLFLGLAIVLALSTGALVATALTFLTALRVARAPDD
jgi:MFS family permease